MASSKKTLAAMSTLSGKRKPDMETKPIMKKHKETSKKKEAAVTKKTLFVENLSSQTEISHIIEFFKNVGEVVRVQLIVDLNGKLVGCGFVEFASANIAKMALQKKHGEYMHGHKIFLDVADKGTSYLPPKYGINHKVWYEDYIRRERQEDETPLDFVEAVAIRKKTLFFAHLSYQTDISDIIKFFKDVGEVVSVRLTVNCEGKHVVSDFVEFSSSNDAKKAREKKNGKSLHYCKIFLDPAKTAPYPSRAKYNLGEIVWYEDQLRRKRRAKRERRASFLVEGGDDLVPMMDVFCGTKITIFYDD